MAERREDRSIAQLLLDSARRVEFRRTHDLIALLDLLEDHQIPPPPGAAWLDELNPYAVEARYGTIDPEGLDRGHAIEAAEQVLASAQTKIAS
jgi:HEPN domain-containing protein